MKLTQIMPAGKTLLDRHRKGLSLTARIALTIVTMALPAVIVCSLVYLSGFSITGAVPLWTDDEPWWYLQFAAVSKYGKPLGYFGYAGTHAAVGTFGPWGKYPALLTGTLARIFGWDLHAFVIYNLAYLAVAALIFILLTRPTLRGHIMLVISNCFMYLAFCYCIVSMSEIARYSVAIVLSGIMYRILVEPQVPRWRLVIRCTLVPLLLVYAVFFYLLLVLFVPIYLYLMLRRLHIVLRAVLIVPLTELVLKLHERFNTITTAPYLPPAPTSSSMAFAVPSARAQLTIDAFDLLGDVKNIDPLTLLTSGENDSTHAMLLWFCLLVFICLGVFLWRTVCAYRQKDQTTAELNLFCAFLLAGSVGGMVTNYNTTTWTFLRNCNTGVCCVMLLAALAPKGQAHGWRVIAIMGLAGVVSFLGVFTSFFATSARFPAASIQASWEEPRQELADVIVLDEDAKNPWSNTVVLYHTDTYVYYLLPYGVGVNGYVEGSINENAKYVILGHSYDDPAERAQDEQTLLDSGHRPIYENDDLTVYENTARSYS